MCPGPQQKPCSVRLRRVVWHHCPSDSRIQYSVGSQVFHEEPGSGRRTAAAAGRVSLRGEEHVCRRAVDGTELSEAVHAAGRTCASGAHVHDTAAVRLQLLLYPAEHGGDGAHRPGGRRLQDQTSRSDAGAVAPGHQRLLQRLLDGAFLQTHARLPQIRLLPNAVGHRRPAAGGGARPRRRVDGREEEGVVRRREDSLVCFQSEPRFAGVNARSSRWSDDPAVLQATPDEQDVPFPDLSESRSTVFCLILRKTSHCVGFFGSLYYIFDFGFSDHGGKIKQNQQTIKR